MSKPRYVIISTMKNEAPFIIDWAAHHLMLGFEHLIVATNDCEDSTNDILDRLGEITGRVTRHKTIIRRGGIQRSAIRQCYYQYEISQNAEWCYICDVDEYLNIKIGDGSLENLLNHITPGISAVPIPWRTFGTTPWPGYIDRPISTLAYRCEFISQPFVDPQVTGKWAKTIFRPSDAIRRPGIHRPIIQDEELQNYKFEYPGGIPIGGDNDFENRLESYQYAQINHYAVRSLDSYLVKISRGRPNHTHHVMGEDYWNKHNRRDEFDHSIERYNDRFFELRGQLMSDPVLVDHHNRGIMWHTQKIREMRKNPDVEDFINKIENELYTNHLPSQLVW